MKARIFPKALSGSNGKVKLLGGVPAQFAPPEVIVVIDGVPVEGTSGIFEVKSKPADRLAMLAAVRTRPLVQVGPVGAVGPSRRG